MPTCTRERASRCGRWVDHLAAVRDISREDAYVAVSLIGDLKIFEIVDAGVWNVGFAVPNALLQEEEIRL